MAIRATNQFGEPEFQIGHGQENDLPEMETNQNKQQQTDRTTSVGSGNKKVDLADIKTSQTANPNKDSARSKTYT